MQFWFRQDVITDEFKLDDAQVQTLHETLAEMKAGEVFAFVLALGS